MDRRQFLKGTAGAAAILTLEQVKARALVPDKKVLLLGNAHGANMFGAFKNMAQAAFYNNGSTAPFGGRTRFKCCRAWTLGNQSTPWLQAFFMPWGLGAVSGHEEVYEATAPVFIPAIYAIFNGVARPITFGGVQGHVFSTTGIGEFSDRFYAQDFGLPNFPSNATIVIKHYYDLVGSNTAPARARGFPNLQRMNYDPANEPANGLTTEMQTSTPFTAPTGAVVQSCFGPNFLIGAPNGDMNSYIVPGDSITADGVGDGVVSQGELAGGYTTRALYRAGEAFIIHGLGGRGMYHTVQNGAFTKATLGAANIALIPQGGNDLSNGHNDVQLESDMKTVTGWMRALKYKKVAWGTVCMRTSDGTPANNLTLYRCTDLANQAPYYTQNSGGLGFGSGEYRDIYDARIIANKGTGNNYPDDVFDTAAFVTDTSTGNNKYKVPTAPFSSTLAASALAGASSVSITDAPTVGDALIFNVGSANVEPVQGDTTMYIVQSVTGAGPYTVTFATVDTYQGGGQIFGRTLGNALSAGAVVKNTWSGDETHPTYPLHKLLDVNVASPMIATYAITRALDPDAATLISSFSTDPGATRRNLINTTILSLKEWDIWRHVVAMGFIAAHEKAAAYRNWKSPGTYDIADAVAPTFTVDRSITGDGTTQSCTVTGLDPSALPALFGLENMFGAILNLAGGTATGWELGCASGNLRISGRSGANASSLINGGGASLFMNPGAATPSFNLGIRRGDGVIRNYANGVPDTTAAAAATVMSNQITLLRSTTQFTNRPLAFYAVGDGGLGDGQIAAFSAIVRRYMSAVGAI